MIPVDDDIAFIVQEKSSFAERRSRTGRVSYTALEIAGYALYREHERPGCGLLERILGWVLDPAGKMAETTSVEVIVEELPD